MGEGFGVGGFRPQMTLSSAHEHTIGQALSGRGGGLPVKTKLLGRGKKSTERQLKARQRVFARERANSQTVSTVCNFC